MVSVFYRVRWLPAEDMMLTDLVGDALVLVELIQPSCALDAMKRLVNLLVWLGVGTQAYDAFPLCF